MPAGPPETRPARRRTVRGGEAKGSPAGDTYPAGLPPGLRAERPRRPRSVSDNGPERPRRHIRGRGGGKAGTRRGSQRGPGRKWLLPPSLWCVYVRAGGGSIPRSSRPGPAEGKRLSLTGSPPVAAEGPGRRSRGARSFRPGLEGVSVPPRCRGTVTGDNVR